MDLWFTLYSYTGVPSWYIAPLTESPYLSPITLTMYNFSEHKRIGDQWSAPFYTGPDGYKIQLLLDWVILSSYLMVIYIIILLITLNILIMIYCVL